MEWWCCGERLEAERLYALRFDSSLRTCGYHSRQRTENRERREPKNHGKNGEGIVKGSIHEKNGIAIDRRTSGNHRSRGKRELMKEVRE